MEKITEVLSKNSYNRTALDKQVLSEYFESFSFFADLLSQDESGSTLKSALSSLHLEEHLENSTLNSGVYVVLKGIFRFSDLEPGKIPKFIKTHNQAKLIPNTPDGLIFEPGLIFGQPDKNERYSIEIIEPCTFAVLSHSDFKTILEKEEEILNEKIEFLRPLDLFKNWSRKAVNSAAKAFEKIAYKKGNFVYKEQDKPENIYLVGEGEFKLTQVFAVNVEDKEKQHEFGSFSILKRPKLKKLIRKTDLQVILKQKGEIFGHNEFINNIEKREFSAICSSNFGVLYSITEKDFFKKFNHPGVIRVLEEQNKVFRMWTSERIHNLKSIEDFKAKIISTSRNQVRISRRERTHEFNLKRRIVRESNTPGKLPKIIDNIINKSTGKADRSVLIFSTEVSMDYFKKKNYLQTIN